MSLGVFSWTVFALWIASEIYIGIRTKQLRRNTNGKNLDRGSSFLIIIAFILGLATMFNFHAAKVGWVNQSVSIVACILVLSGIALRIWSFFVLGRNFSPKVTVDTSQTLVQHGSYKLIRHPTYTGLLLTMTFLGLAFNSWIASIVLFVLFFLVLTYRIHVEEKALVSHFQNDYVQYRENTWRLIPYIW